MPGRHINQQQVSLFMTLRITHTQQTAAAKAGISVGQRPTYREDATSRL